MKHALSRPLAGFNLVDFLNLRPFSVSTSLFMEFFSKLFNVPWIRVHILQKQHCLVRVLWIHSSSWWDLLSVVLNLVPVCFIWQPLVLALGAEVHTLLHHSSCASQGLADLRHTIPPPTVSAGWRDPSTSHRSCSLLSIHFTACSWLFTNLSISRWNWRLSCNIWDGGDLWIYTLM